MNFTHPKLWQVPLGSVADMKHLRQFDQWVHRRVHVARAGLIRQDKLLLISNSGWGPRSALNRKLEQVFGTKNFAGAAPPEYWDHFSTHKFVISPAGIGADCYRTMEVAIAVQTDWLCTHELQAIQLGVVPLVERGFNLERMYSRLPVVRYCLRRCLSPHFRRGSTIWRRLHRRFSSDSMWRFSTIVTCT